MRIAILSPYDEVLAFMDTDLPQAMHFFDDCLHTYRFGLAYTFDFKVLTSHADSRYLKEGNKLAFIYEDVSYYLTIVTVLRTARETSVTAQSLTLELLNEEVDAVESPKVKTATEYISDLGFESDVMVIGTNEVADQKLRLKFESKETIISRLYSIAAAFDAEAEFQVHLKPNYALDRIDLNLKKAGTLKGVGSDRTASVIRYGSEVSGIEKESDISELVTGIRARGKKAKSKVSVEKTEGSLNGKVVRTITKTTIEEDKRKEIRTVTLIRDPEGNLPNFEKVHIRVEYEEDGKIATTERELTNGQKEPFLPTQLSEKKTSTSEAEATEKTMTLMGFGISSVSDENGLYIIDTAGDLRAPDARNRYPSSLKKGSDGVTFKDGYIFRYFENTSAENQIELFESALKELKDGCIPKIKYTIRGYVQGSVGDWLMVEDAQYDPPMYVRCRIMEQEKSLIKPYEGLTTVDNFTEFASRIDTGYRQTLTVPTITQEQNEDGSLTITTESAGVTISSLLQKGEDGYSPQAFVSKSGKVSTFTVTDKSGTSNVQIQDGENGKDGKPGADGKDGQDGEDAYSIEVTPAGSMISKTGFVGIQLTAHVFKGGRELTASEIDGISWIVNGTVKSNGPTYTPSMGDGSSEELTVTVKLGGDRAIKQISLVRVNDGEAGQPGKDGTNGMDGADAPTITSVTGYYCRSSSASSVPSDSSFSTALPTLTATYKYLWMYNHITFSDGSTLNEPKHVAAIRGDNGMDGVNGTNGTNGAGISSVTQHYYRSSSSTKPTSTSSFSTTLPTLTSTYRYLWMYEQFTLTNGSTLTGPIRLGAVYGNTGASGTNGTNGTNGKDGADAPTITSITGYYYRSTSGSSVPADSSFSTTRPTLTSTYKYLWMYDRFTFSDGSTLNGPKHVAAVYGDTGQQGTAGADAVIDEATIKSIVLAAFFPIGSIYIGYTSTNPGTKMGGTWVRIAEGRVLVGQGTSSADANGDTRYFGYQTTGGSAYPLLTPKAEAAGYGLSSGSAGYANRPTLARTDTAAKPDIMPQYQVVYYWRRTA